MQLKVKVKFGRNEKVLFLNWVILVKEDLVSGGLI